MLLEILRLLTLLHPFMWCFLLASPSERSSICPLLTMMVANMQARHERLRAYSFCHEVRIGMLHHCINLGAA